jgi:hypothetical protein
MFAIRKTFELAVCLLGYYLGKGFGGWGGGIVLAFAGICATSYGWEKISTTVFAQQQRPTAQMNFIFSAVSFIIVAGSSYMLWGK